MESFDKKSMDSVASFITFYHTQGQILCDKMVQTRTSMTSSQKEIVQINKDLDDLEKLWGESSTAYCKKYVQQLVFHY